MRDAHCGECKVLYTNRCSKLTHLLGETQDLYEQVQSRCKIVMKQPWQTYGSWYGFRDRETKSDPTWFNIPKEKTKNGKRELEELRRQQSQSQKGENSSENSSLENQNTASAVPAAGVQASTANKSTEGKPEKEHIDTKLDRAMKEYDQRRRLKMYGSADSAGAGGG